MKTTPKKPLDVEMDIELILYMNQEMTQRQVADAMGITQGAVALIEKKAINKFRQKLMTKRIYSMDWIF